MSTSTKDDIVHGWNKNFGTKMVKKSLAVSQRDNNSKNASEMNGNFLKMLDIFHK
jgi:hypothetical protein